MKTAKPKIQTISRHDYGPALQGALSWLGDRYLLAEPLNRRGEDRKLPANDAKSMPDRITGVGLMA